METKFRRARWAAPLSFAIMLAATAPSRGADVSAWDKDSHSGLRLIAGSTPRDRGAAVLRAGIELRLDPGWKTYWRYAGDSGLPPKFDLSGSENVQSAKVLWPAPSRFPDGGGGHSIGYFGGVIFPVHIVAQDPAKPVTLRVRASYGVCDTICIPASGNTELLLNGGGASEEALLVAAEAQVPRPAAFGGDGPLAVRSARREREPGQRERVVVDVTAPQDANVSLFAEGPTAQWSLPLPEPLGDATGGSRRFAFDVDGVPPGARIEGALLRLTLIAGEDAIEVTTHIN
jgi:DsbC/DsbD-like thiol-disulfide interchange protein